MVEPLSNLLNCFLPVVCYFHFQIVRCDKRSQREHIESIVVNHEYFGTLAMLYSLLKH